MGIYIIWKLQYSQCNSRIQNGFFFQPGIPLMPLQEYFSQEAGSVRPFSRCANRYNEKQQRPLKGEWN